MDFYIQDLWNFGKKISNKQQYFDCTITTNDDHNILCHKFILCRNKIMCAMFDFDGSGTHRIDFDYETTIIILSVIYGYDYDFNYYFNHGNGSGSYSTKNKAFKTLELLTNFDDIMEDFILKTEEEINEFFIKKNIILIKPENTVLKNIFEEILVKSNCFSSFSQLKYVLKKYDVKMSEKECKKSFTEIMKIYVAADFLVINNIKKDIELLFSDIDDALYLELLDYAEYQSINVILKEYQAENIFSCDLLLKITNKVDVLYDTIIMELKELNVERIDEINDIAEKLQIKINVDCENIESMEIFEALDRIIIIMKKSNFYHLQFDCLKFSLKTKNFNDLIKINKYSEIKQIKELINNFIGEQVLTLEDAVFLKKNNINSENLEKAIDNTLSKMTLTFDQIKKFDESVMTNRTIKYEYTGENYDLINEITSKLNIKIILKNKGKVNPFKIKNLYGLIDFASKLFLKNEIKYFEKNKIKIYNMNHYYNLETLVIKKSKLDDLSFLKFFSNLKELIITNTIIKNLDNITSSSLEKITMNNCELTKIPEFQTENLEVLNLEYNNIKKITNNNIFKHLKRINLKGNHIKDYDILTHYSLKYFF